MNEITNERLILSALLQDDIYCKKVQAFLKPEYFQEDAECKVFSHIKSFIEEYSNPPNLADLTVSVKNDETVGQKLEDRCLEIIKDVFDITPSKNIDFLVDTTEKFCIDKAMFLAIQESIQIYKGESKLQRHAIPKLLQDAMGVSFDARIGQEYTDDAEQRWDYYKNPSSKIAFDISIFNKVTNGGVTRKTLNCLAAGINVGKTTCLVSLAAMYKRLGLNVLYCSNEMSEEEILNRVDANLFNVTIDEVKALDKEDFMGKIDRIKQKSYGKLYVKEYPTGTASAANYRHLINEMRIKKTFIPDVLIVDYLQITASSGSKGNDNSYQKYKQVAEELRALCIEFSMVGWTACQLNRVGMGSTDPGMTETGESLGIPATMDGMWGLVRTEELDSVGQIMVIEMKTRYGNKSIPRFPVGINISTQKMYDVDQIDPRKYNATVKTEVKRAPVDNKSKSRFSNFKVTNDHN